MTTLICGYVKHIANSIAAILPENPAIARRVLSDLEGRIGRPWRKYAAVAAVVGVLASVGTKAMDADEDGPHQAMIVRATDGHLYVIIFETLAGKPTTVANKVLISPTDAAHKLKQPGWQAGAIKAYLAL
jgi:hypothetical protein